MIKSIEKVFNKTIMLSSFNDVYSTNKESTVYACTFVILFSQNDCKIYYREYLKDRVGKVRGLSGVSPDGVFSFPPLLFSLWLFCFVWVCFVPCFPFALVALCLLACFNKVFASQKKNNTLGICMCTQ